MSLLARPSATSFRMTDGAPQAFAKAPSLRTLVGATAIVDSPIPVLVARLGSEPAKRFLSFFTDQIRNRHTREAYHRAVCRFFAWCEERGLPFERVESFHVSAYIEGLLSTHSKPTVKQHLAAIRTLYDWLVVGQVCRSNPAAAVRGPRYSVTRGRTPVLSEDDAKRLLASIDATTLVGLRDRALIATMTYTFGRVSAVVGMRVGDYYPNGKRWWVRLHEKGGRDHELPAHHKLEEYLDAYLDAAQIAEDPRRPLFASISRSSGRLSDRPLDRRYVWRVLRKRAAAAGLSTRVSPHSLRATGITNYMSNGGSLAEARKIAAHADSRTTQLYDRSGDTTSLDEIERISI